LKKENATLTEGPAEKNNLKKVYASLVKSEPADKNF
jgi:hypothetical protein